jgi:uncharacterized low-complexity protein
MNKSKIATLVLGVALATSGLVASDKTSAKCGTGKCGSKKVEKPSTAKCGSKKVEKPSTAKCGAGKCGSGK